MYYKLMLLTILLVTSLVVNSKATSQAPQDDSEKPLYYLTGNEASVVGRINVTGTIPKPLRIDMSPDPVCVELAGAAPETESLITKDNKLKNAFVYLMDGPLQNYRFAVSHAEVTLQRDKCQYSPRVMGVQVGQPLQIVNNDPTVHNTHPTPRMNQEWNQTQVPFSAPLVKTFSRAEVFIPFKCNQHPWERAYVGVMKHPYFAVSDRAGKFKIDNVPPGTYKVVVWHEKLGEKEMELTVVPGETRRADFTFETP